MPIPFAATSLGIVCSLLLLTACRQDSETPALAFSEISTWRVPIDGPQLPAPRSVACSPIDDSVVVLDNAGRVLVYDAQGKVIRRWMMPDIEVGRPEGVVILKDGRVVVCDTHYSRIIVFDSSGEILKMFGSYGREPGQFVYPVAITTDAEENLYIGEYGDNDRIQKFTVEGELLGAFGSFGTEPGQFQRPSGLAWMNGKLYVADAVNNRIQVFTDGGKFIEALPLKLHLPYDLTVNAQGEFSVIEYGAGRITSFHPDGTAIGRFGSQGAKKGQFLTPWGLTVDSQGRIRVADTGNRRLVALTPTQS